MLQNRCSDASGLSVQIKPEWVFRCGRNMHGALKGRTIHEAKHLFEQFHHLVTIDDQVDDVGKLIVLAGVRAFPMRVKCATLAWHTLQAALNNKTSATTE